MRSMRHDPRYQRYIQKLSSLRPDQKALLNDSAIASRLSKEAMDMLVAAEKEGYKAKKRKGDLALRRTRQKYDKNLSSARFATMRARNDVTNMNNGLRADLAKMRLDYDISNFNRDYGVRADAYRYNTGQNRLGELLGFGNFMASAYFGNKRQDLENTYAANINRQKNKYYGQYITPTY